MFEVNNKVTRTASGVFIVHFEHISHLVLVFLLLTLIEETVYSIHGAFRDLVPFVPFKIVKNTHGAVLLLVTLLHGCFSRFLYCTDGTKRSTHLTFT